MGYQFSVYVGPYLAVKDAVDQAPAQAAGCPRGCASTGQANARFCASCGASIQAARKAGAVPRKLYCSRLPDEFVDEFFSPEFIEGVKGETLWLPNRGGGASFDEASAPQALPLQAQQAIDDFSERYGRCMQAIEQLEGFSGMELRYGVVPYSV